MPLDCADKVAAWTRLRDACEEQIRRLTEEAAKSVDGIPAPALGYENMPPEDQKLVDKIIDSGDLGNFPTATATAHKEGGHTFYDLDFPAPEHPIEGAFPVNPATIKPTDAGVILTEEMTREEFKARYPDTVGDWVSENVEVKHEDGQTMFRLKPEIPSPQPIEQTVKIPAPMEDLDTPF